MKPKTDRPRPEKGGYESADISASELGPFPEVLTRPALMGGPEQAFRRALADRMPREVRPRDVTAFDERGAPMDAIDLAWPLIRDYLAA